MTTTEVDDLQAALDAIGVLQRVPTRGRQRPIRWVAEQLHALGVRPPTTAHQAQGGAELIAAERRRQAEKEGWTPEHDAAQVYGSLALAAACYAMPEPARNYSSEPAGAVPTLWPWLPRFWKPTPDDRVRELVKAGALIAAEIDRLQAAALSAKQSGGRQ